MNLDLDRDENGKPLPTLKNREIIHALEKKLGGLKMMEDYHDDFIEYTKWVLFDPRSKQHMVVYRTPEEALTAKKYWDGIEKLDQEYLKSKSKK